MPLSASASPLLCLASVSPRRRALLQQIGVPHLTAVPDVDETALAGESAPGYVVRIACAKARVIAERGAQLPVLGADTIVVVDGRICGKPADAQQGIDMLRQLSGRSHEVLTAVALAKEGRLEHRLSTSQVRFRPLSLAECRAYWESGEPRDKAGGYAIQGHGAVFIEHLSGSYSGVMGLPLFETAQLLAAAGVPYWMAAPGATP